MAKTHKLVVEPMTAESFAPFGELIDITERPSGERIIAPLAYHAEGRTTLSALWQPYQGRTFWQLERHFGVTQSFIQLGGAPAVVAVAVPTDPNDQLAIPQPDQVRAFLIDPEKGYSFAVGTWHSLHRYVLAPPGATFAVINSDPNPSQVVDFKDNYSVTYTDLESDNNPVRVNLGDKFGVIFELSL
jgi:ureidoglycolate lyase